MVPREIIKEEILNQEQYIKLYETYKTRSEYEHSRYRQHSYCLTILMKIKSKLELQEKDYDLKTTIDNEFEIDADIILNKDKIQQGHKPGIYE